MKDRRINPDDDAREVLRAITQGKDTFNEIRRATTCTSARVSEALAALLTAPRKPLIRLERDGESARFFPVAQRGEVRA